MLWGLFSWYTIFISWQLKPSVTLRACCLQTRHVRQSLWRFEGRPDLISTSSCTVALSASPSPYKPLCVSALHVCFLFYYPRTFTDMIPLPWSLSPHCHAPTSACLNQIHHWSYLEEPLATATESLVLWLLCVQCPALEVSKDKKKKKKETCP